MTIEHLNEARSVPTPDSLTTSSSRDRRDAVVIGVDYGTLSGRAVVIRVSDGEALGSAVHEYPHGVLDSELPTGEPRAGPPPPRRAAGTICHAPAPT